MNYPIFIVAIVFLFSLIAHITVGNKETLRIRPEKIAEPESIPEFEKVDRSWVQAICAFQLITVDLLALTALLFTISATDFIVPRKPIAIGISIYLCMWGGVWLLQMFLLRRRGKEMFFLPQWVQFFVCAALVYWGSRTL
jgi:hypothetical protein